MPFSMGCSTLSVSNSSQACENKSIKLNWSLENNKATDIPEVSYSASSQQVPMAHTHSRAADPPTQQPAPVLYTQPALNKTNLSSARGWVFTTRPSFYPPSKATASSCFQGGRCLKYPHCLQAGLAKVPVFAHPCAVLTHRVRMGGHVFLHNFMLPIPGQLCVYLPCVYHRITEWPVFVRDL